jgi:uncharacterized OB-fold protein
LYYLPQGLPEPVPAADGLDADFWAALERQEIVVQACRRCGTRQFPEWICHDCLSFDLTWVSVRPKGTIFSWGRVWNASHPAVRAALPYLVVLVQLDDAPEVRMIGNLLGDPMQSVEVDAPVDAVYERHPRFTLVQWQVASG